MYCRQCGHEMADGEGFCMQCGTAAADGTGPAGPASGQATGREGADWRSRAAMPPPPPPIWQGQAAVPLPYGQPAAPGARPKGRKKPLVIALIAAGCVLALVAGMLVPVLIEKDRADRYEAARTLMDDEEYEEAIAAFAEMGAYKDSPEMVAECRDSLDYAAAQALMDAGEYERAREGFAALGRYRDAADQAQACRDILDYGAAAALMDAREYEHACEAFAALGDYRDAADQAQTCRNILDYDAAAALMDAGRYADAKTAFSALGDYSDAALRVEECQRHIDYSAADEAYQSGLFYTAHSGFQWLDDFADAPARAAACEQDAPKNGELYHHPDYAKKISIYIKNKGKSIGMLIKFYTVDGEMVSTAYVAPGKKVKIRLPRGEYAAKLAWGPQWFGEKECFGDYAFYGWSNERFVLSSRYYYIYEVLTPEARSVWQGELTYSDF